MDVKELLENVAIVQTLGTYPNQEDGLSPEELKAKFDQAAQIIKEYLNNQIVPAIRDVGDAVEDLIKDDEVRLDHTWSSKKIFEEIETKSVVSDNKFDNVYDIENCYLNYEGHLVNGPAEQGDYYYYKATSKYYDIGELTDGCVYIAQSYYIDTSPDAAIALYDENKEVLYVGRIGNGEIPHRINMAGKAPKYFRVYASAQFTGNFYVSGMPFDIHDTESIDYSYFQGRVKRSEIDDSASDPDHTWSAEKILQMIAQGGTGDIVMGLRNILGVGKLTLGDPNGVSGIYVVPRGVEESAQVAEIGGIIGGENVILRNVAPGKSISDAVNKEQLDAAVGDIETALDSILAIQNTLIGGDEA